jgi:hypothetical protein
MNKNEKIVQNESEFVAPTTGMAEELPDLEKEFPKSFNVLYYPGAGRDVSWPIMSIDAKEYVFNDYDTHDNPDFLIKEIEKSRCKIVSIENNKDEKYYKIIFTKTERHVKSDSHQGYEDVEVEKVLRYYYGQDAASSIPDNTDLLYVQGYFPLSGSRNAQETIDFLRKIPEGCFIYDQGDSMIFPEMMGIHEIEYAKCQKINNPNDERIVAALNLQTALSVLPSGNYEKYSSSSEIKKKFLESYNQLSDKDREYVKQITAKYEAKLQYLGI